MTTTTIMKKETMHDEADQTALLKPKPAILEQRWHAGENGREARCEDTIGDSGVTVAACYTPALSALEQQSVIASIVEQHNAALPAEPVQRFNDGPRFVWMIGSLHEQYPDVPQLESNDAVLWDRLKGKAVVTLAREYANAFCLETNWTPADQPFTTLENWMNSLSNEDMDSEGLPT